VVQAAQQKPEDLDRTLCFKEYIQVNGYYPGHWPLHHAICLDLGIDVIKALISPISIKNKDHDGSTHLHNICFHSSASLELLMTCLARSCKRKEQLGTNTSTCDVYKEICIIGIADDTIKSLSGSCERKG